ncbi:MAG: CDP-alcohol phosphatidyltransferase family protein [Clostridia bacterium]|nr:CDP-alcohol phosphatidyltransferase family protein [Clostridia bacterium]
MKHLPNILTSIRILMAGVFACFFMEDNYTACCVSFGVSMLTDILDGALARAHGWVSDLGKILDPVADKVTLLVISICFYRAGWIPQYMMIAVIIKESIMMLGGLIMLRCHAVAYADTFGKAATTLFSTSIVMALIRELNFSPFLTRICSASTLVFGLSVAFSFVALVHYGRTQFAQRKA